MIYELGNLSINYIKRGNASTVPFWFIEPLRPFFFLVATLPSGTIATVATAFFYLFSLPFVLFFPFIYIYIYCYTDVTNFTIFSQLLRCQFLISQNKIIKYETVTNHE